MINLVLGFSRNLHKIDDNFLQKFNSYEIKDPSYFRFIENKQYLYHSNYSVTLDDVYSLIKHEINDLLPKNLKFKRISFDIGPSYSSVDVKNNMYYPKSNFLEKHTIISILESQITKLKQLCDNNVELAIENLNFYPTGAYKNVCEPAFYNEICDKFQLFQVLDISHLLVSCFYMNIDFKTMLDKVNHKYVKEIHISKPNIIDKKMIDSHDIPVEDDFENLYSAIIKNKNKDIDVVIEYWQNPSYLPTLYNNLYEFLLSKNLKVSY